LLLLSWCGLVDNRPVEFIRAFEARARHFARSTKVLQVRAQQIFN
jgi:hypothetical protein